MSLNFQGCTVVLEPGHSLQEGIEQAEEGAVICLSPRMWRESLQIEKSLTLRGLGDGERPVILGGRKGCPVVWVRAPEGREGIMVRLEGLKLEGAYGPCADWPKGLCPDGILVQGPARVKVVDCEISSNRRSGIALWSSAEAIIKSSIISKNGHYGLWLWGEVAVELDGSIISGNGIGPGAEAGSAPARDGLMARGRARIMVLASTISENGHYGLWLADEARALVRRSTISGNRAGGLWLRDQARGEITDSLIARNGVGIQLADRACAAIIENRIIKNEGYGVLLYHRPCYRTTESFAGHVTGHGNEIPGPDKPDGNSLGDVCPSRLGFLQGRRKPPLGAGA